MVPPSPMPSTPPPLPPPGRRGGCPLPRGRAPASPRLALRVMLARVGPEHLAHEVRARQRWVVPPLALHSHHAVERREVCRGEAEVDACEPFDLRPAHRR